MATLEPITITVTNSNVVLPSNGFMLIGYDDNHNITTFITDGSNPTPLNEEMKIALLRQAATLYVNAHTIVRNELLKRTIEQATKAPNVADNGRDMGVNL